MDLVKNQLVNTVAEQVARTVAMVNDIAILKQQVAELRDQLATLTTAAASKSVWGKKKK